MIYQKDPFTEKQEKAFLAWLRTLPSWLDGAEPCEACHVRRVHMGAGTGRKPRLFSVPMSHSQHLLQGESEWKCIDKYISPDAMTKFSLDFTDLFMEPEAIAKLLFEKAAMYYRERFLTEVWSVSNGI